MYKLEIGLSEALMAFVEQQSHEQGYSGPGEYVRMLIAREQAQNKVALELLNATSSEAIPVDDAYWQNKKERLLRQLNGE